MRNATLRYADYNQDADSEDQHGVLVRSHPILDISLGRNSWEIINTVLVVFMTSQLSLPRLMSRLSCVAKALATVWPT